MLVLIPCSPEIDWLVPMFLKIEEEKHFLCFLFPNSAFVLLKRWHLFPISPEINAIFPISQNLCEGLTYGR